MYPLRKPSSQTQAPLLGQVATPAKQEQLSAQPLLQGERRLVRWSWHWPFVAILLIVVWLLVLLGLPAWMPPLAASCLTFIALLITPGYLLADMLAWRLALDKLEQLALALPLGLAVLSLPGIAALLLHRTLIELAAGWFVTSAVVVFVWLLACSGFPLVGAIFRNRASIDRESTIPWALDEILLFLVVAILFALILPALSVPKIDGDAYAVNTFAIDALAGLPLNGREPLFGTDLGPGVRMVFNQSLPLSYLWSYLSGLDSISLISRYSRQILALWAVLAIYMLGKAAGAGSRRLGLFTAAIQLLLYAAAPFWRGDNVSLYFFERINADKFMVVVLLLPPCFALAIRYVRQGGLDTWLATAVVVFAISTIHPLGAAMVALALSAFGACHLLLNLRHGLSWWRRVGPAARKAVLLFSVRYRPAWQRSLGLLALVAVVMFLPVLQLLLSRGEAPLAASYPKSFEGWSIGETSVPIFPFLNARGLTLYGPLPRVDQLKADDANMSTSPFLVWRFAANMDRQRLVFFGVDRYISDPRLLLELPYLMALLMLLYLRKQIRSNPAIQLVTGTTLAILFVMFNPILMPIIGSMVMPWILWRLIWLLPYPLILALAAQQLLAPQADMPVEPHEGEPVPRSWLGMTIPRRASGVYALPAFLVILALLAAPAMLSHLRYLGEDAAASYFYPTPGRIFARLNELTGPDRPATVLADQDLSVTLAAYVANANILAHRVPTTSEIFPADQQNIALQRLMDQDKFFRTPYLTPETIDILARYGVKYIITSSGSELDLQLQLAPLWFQRQLDDHSYTLYSVLELPSETFAIQGNEAMAGRDWARAEAVYKSALEQDAGDLLATAGLAKIAQQRGQFDEALSWWRLALAQADLPVLHARLGELHALRGEIARSAAEWEQAALRAPDVARYHIGLGDACLRNSKEDCAAEQYAAAVDQRSLPDQATRLMMQANLWQAQGRYDKALPLYEQAVLLQPLRFNQYILESAYREAGQTEQSASLLQKLRLRSPFSAELATANASVLARQDRVDEATRLYRRAIFLEQLEVQDTIDTRLRLIQLLLDAGRFREAGREIEKTLALAPFSGEAHRLQGDFHRLQGELDQALEAYRQAFMLDSTRLDTYISLNNLLRQKGGPPEGWLWMLQIAIRSNPEEPSLYLAMGDYWQGQGDGGAAIAAYLTALDKLDSGASSNQFLSPSTRQGRAFIYSRLAQIYEDGGQATAAANYYQAMAVMAPEVPWTQIILGDARRRQNDLVAAETRYRQALENDPGYLIAYLRLAEIKEARGEATDASALRQMTMQLAEAQLMQAPPMEDLAHSQQRSSFRDLPVFSDSASAAAPAAQASDSILSHIQASEEQVSTLGLLTHLYQVSGETDQAIDLYQAALTQSEKNGGSPALRAQYHKGLADLHRSQGQLDLAVEHYRQAIALDGWWSEARLGLATALTAQGQKEAAVMELQTAAELSPGLLEVRLALAEGLVREGRSSEAQAIYEAAAQQHPGSTRLTEALAEFYAAHRQPRLALPLYQQALVHDPSNASLYLALSQLWLSQGDAVQAKAVLESGLEAASDPTGLTTALATLYLQQNEPEQALAILGQGISRLGENTQLLLAMGAYYVSRGNDDQAAQWYEGARSKDPGSPAVQVALAELATHLKKPDESLSHYEQAVALAPAASGYRLALANAYQSNQRFDEAIAAYSQVLASEPDLPEAYTGLAEALRTQERWDEARLTYERGRVQAPTSAWLMSAYAGFLLERGEETQALDLIEKAKEQAQDVPTMVTIAALYDKTGQAEASEALLKTALEHEPGSILALTALGDLYEAQGRTAEAKALYEEIVALAPGISTGYLRLGNLANAAGDQDAADQYAALAQEVSPEAFGP